MLTPGSAVRVFIAVEPFKMFGSFDALAGAVRRLGLDPLDGHLYVFLSRRRHMAKVLWFDKTGWCVLSKRLERGTFQLPSIPDGASQVRVDAAALSALLAGIDLDAPDGAGTRVNTAPEVRLSIGDRHVHAVVIPSLRVAGNANRDGAIAR